MDNIEVFRMAYTAIKTNKTRSFLTTLGIIIGVGSVILLVAIGAGLQAFVTQEFESLGSNVLFISPGKINFSGGGPPQNMEAKFGFEDIEKISKLGDPIVDASGMISKGATIKYRSKSFYGSIAGVEEDYREFGNVEIQSGEFFGKSAIERSQMVGVIGHKIYTELFGEGREAVGKEIDISGRKIKVIGVLKEKGGGISAGQGDNVYVVLPLTTAQKVTGIDKPAAAMVRTKDAEGTAIATRKVKEYFYRKNLTDDDFTVLEPKELLDTITQFLGVVTGALSGIAAISLVVGGIGIANIMLVSVTERTREIGLRKAIGATKRDILIQFLVEAMMLSLLGGGIGIVIGWGMAELLKQFIETAVTLNSVMLAFGISAIVGIVSGIAPAIRAGNLNPIDALRYE
jgi:putative ABC transport system permease protein